MCLGGCVGGSQGTGVRPDKNLTNRPGIQPVDPAITPIFKLIHPVDDECEIKSKSDSITARVESDVGPAIIAGRENSICTFALPIQANKFEMVLEDWPSKEQSVEYRLLEFGCDNKDAGREVAASAVKLKDDKFSLPAMRIDSSHRYQIILKNPELSQGELTLKLQGDATNLCQPILNHLGKK